MPSRKEAEDSQLWEAAICDEQGLTLSDSDKISSGQLCLNTSRATTLEQEGELKLEVQKNTGGRPVKILRVIRRLYVYCSAVILDVCDLVRLV
jgi:hypothetical protein